MVEIGAPLDTHSDFSCGVAQRALLSRPRSSLRVAREQLELRRTGSEGSELEDESLDAAGGRRLLEPSLEWRRDARGVGGRVFE